MTDTTFSGLHENVIPFRRDVRVDLPPSSIIEEPLTPITDKLLADAKRLDSLSAYRSEFDYEIYRRLEKRFARKPMRGGIIMQTGFRLANSHPTCQQCLYAFEIDTYGRGCIHDCVYCYAKAELTVHGYWNNPVPAPININDVRKAFFYTFETDKTHKWREILSRRIPLRIGSMSDSFMWTDRKYKVTQELLRILKHYNYPHIVFTRSDLIAQEEYLSLIDPKIATVQFSISSTNKELSRQLEPGAPSPAKRLKAVKQLVDAGVWTTIRINPLFPMYPDGYFTDPSFAHGSGVPSFPYSSFDMIDEFADHGTKSVLAGFVRLSAFSISRIKEATGVDLKAFYRKDVVDKSRRDYHFTDKEIRSYYDEYKRRCAGYGMQFSTCYIGNGDDHFWKDQDLWSNKSDCCNAKQQVPAFKTDCREIPFEQRLKHTNKKDLEAISSRLHDPI